MEKTIEQLTQEKDSAYLKYSESYDKTKKLLKNYEAAKQAFIEATAYEKAKKQVMRDLIKSAGNIADGMKLEVKP